MKEQRDEEPTQEYLFDVSRWPKIPAEEKPKWYYIGSPDGDLMVVTDENEGLVWIPEDLQYIVPHLFNNPSTARKQAKSLGKPFKIILYPYTSQWWLR